MKKTILNSQERFFLNTDTYFGARLRLFIAWVKFNREIGESINKLRLLSNIK